MRSVLGGLASALFGVTIAFLPESVWGGAPYFFAFYRLLDPSDGLLYGLCHGFRIA